MRSRQNPCYGQEMRIPIAGLILAACGGSPAPIANNTSVAPTGPSYRIDRTPIDSTTLGWIIDLRAPTMYFKVYLTAGTKGEDRCALVPRPDGDLASACKKRNAMGDIARRNGLCDVPVSEGDFVDRINRMDIDDCLSVKRTLEAGLRFEAMSDHGGAWAVMPTPHKSDVQKICAKTDRAGLGASLCEYYSPQHTTEELRFFSEKETKLLARRLNELYGR